MIHAPPAREGQAMHGTEYGSMSSDHGSGFVTGLLCGAAVGAAIGLLLAPRSGAEMRRTLADSAERWREKGRESYDAASETVNRVVDQGRRAAEAGRARVEDAVNEGRAVFVEQMSGSRPRDVDAV
jgi:gas vesicle protein